MNFSRYLRDKVLALLIMFTSLLMALLVLYVFNLQTGSIVFVGVVILSGFALILAVDYLRRRRFYRELSQTLECLDETYLITELISRPGFLEGDLTYDALADACKAMNDRIASYRIASEEYREYIETWIHEVKTPIAAAHLMAENHKEPAVAAMDGEVSRIEGYVEQALFFSRSTAVERDFIIKQENLGDLVRESVRRNARLLIDAYVTPQLGNLDYQVFADSKWMAFALGQIVGNAAKYRKPTDEASALFFSAQQYDVGLDTVRTVLTIADQGIGIPAADIARVFDKGFTGENGRIFEKSTGIGLYLCKQLCCKMGLDIQLDSQVNQGTVVTITFPQNKMHFVE